jgi:hypothetical protein
VWVCKNCAHPTAEAQLTFQRETSNTHSLDPEDFAAKTQSITPLPTNTLTARLTATEQVRARRAEPGVGERFTPDLETSEFPRLVKGAEPLAPALAFQRCVTGDQEAAVRIRGNRGEVIAALLAQSNEPTKGQVGPSTVISGVTVTPYRYGYYTGLVVIDDPQQPDPIGILEWCND